MTVRVTISRAFLWVMVSKVDFNCPFCGHYYLLPTSICQPINNNCISDCWPGSWVSCNATTVFWHIETRTKWQILCYRQFSNIRRTQSPNINVFRLVFQLSLPNPLKPRVKLRMKMELEQRRQAMLQLHLSDQQFYCLLRCALYKRLYGNFEMHLM